jgi:hypothetical protein
VIYSPVVYFWEIDLNQKFPRSQALAFYVSTRFKGGEKLSDQLGKYKKGNGGWWYINKLDDVDLVVLEQIIRRSLSVRQRETATVRTCLI